MRRSAGALLLPLLLLAAPRAGAGGADDAPWTEDLEALLAGVTRIAAPGVPGTIAVYGEKAFPVVVAAAGDGPAAVAAAARLGRGRVFALGHDGYLRDEAPPGDTAALVANAVRWLGGRRDGDRPPRVAQRNLPALGPLLRGAGIPVEPASALDASALRGVDVLALPTARLDEAAVDAVRAFVRRGGGLLAAETGWGWLSLHPGASLATDLPGNRVLREAGLLWGRGTIRVPPDRLLPVAPPPPTVHGGVALARLEQAGDGDDGTAAAADALVRLLRDLPADDEDIRPALARAARRRPARHLPGPDAPLRRAEGLDRVLLAMEVMDAQATTPERTPAHPAAAAFPGAVPRTARAVRTRVAVPTERPGWHGTGLYAAPGAVVTLDVPAEAADQGLGLRIGAHTDLLWDHEAWKRAPEITRRFEVRTRHTTGACAFGGPVYVEVPRPLALGTIEVVVAGAVPAPRYVLGTTDAAGWAAAREAPAPWAELEARTVVLTLPSEVVRGLEDPAPLLAFWDRVLDACADLAARPRERVRPERYVTDVQISAGYMHSGYPIMTHLDAAPRFVDLETLSRRGDWGMFHEMGHNHQSPDWTFDGTGEVTVNLFTLYVLDTVCAGATGHEGMRPEARARRQAAHLAAGAPFDRWKSDPFLALIPYVQLREAFGWEAYQRVFAAYRDLLPAERPRDDAAKRDQWMERFSRTVGRDLGPFFAAWGIPVSDAARARVAGLPPWMPPDLPAPDGGPR